ncbi:hypothetical protein Tco_0107791, partial [Tanacetum coccineum]
MSKLLYTRFTKLIIGYLLSLNKSIPHRSDSKLHSLQDDHPITKLLSTTNDEYKFGMEVPDAMISDAIKKKAGYKCYMAKKVEVRKIKSLINQKSNTYLQSKMKEEKICTMSGDRNSKVLQFEDLAVQSLLDLRKGSKASRLKSLRQKKQPVAGEGSSVDHNKYYSSSDTASDATLYSLSSDESEESENETDDTDESDTDLSNDIPHR